LRAKFTNDSNFFVREVGRGSGVLECSLFLFIFSSNGTLLKAPIVYWLTYIKSFNLLRYSQSRDCQSFFVRYCAAPHKYSSQ